VKGFGWYSPFVSDSYIELVSLGYTRDISDFIAVDIIANYNKVYNAETGSYNSRTSFIPSLRFYFGSANNQNSGLWICGYPVLGVANYWSNTKSYRTFEYGVGFGGGFRINISKNKRWIMDMGIGASYRMSDILFYSDETVIDPTSGLYSVVEKNFDYPPSELWVPQMILQIGYKF